MMREWLDGLRAGRTFVTNGPLLSFTLGGKEPGEEIRLPVRGGDVKFTAELGSIVPVDHFELLCNGEVQKKFLAEPGRSAQKNGTVRLNRSGWCLLRAYAEKAAHPILDLYPFATTSPVYVTVEGAPARSPEDAAFFVQWMDRVLEFARGRTNWNTPEERAHALAYLENARAVFAGKAQTTPPQK
jgi:TolB protein